MICPSRFQQKEPESVVFVEEEFMRKIKKIQKKEDVFGDLASNLPVTEEGRQLVSNSVEACGGYKGTEKFDKVCSYYLS